MTPMDKLVDPMETETVAAQVAQARSTAVAAVAVAEALEDRLGERHGVAVKARKAAEAATRLARNARRLQDRVEALRRELTEAGLT